MKLGTLTTVAFEVGLSRPVDGDFPLAGGLLQFQGVGSSYDGASPPASSRRRGRLAGGPGCNFALSVDLSVMLPS